MKGIIIKDCDRCPYRSTDTSFAPNKLYIICSATNKRIDDITKIPDWCPLQDMQEILDIAKFDYDLTASKSINEK